VDVFSPCVTYNKDNTYQWFNPRVKILEEQGHDPTDLHKAIERGLSMGRRNSNWIVLARTDLEAWKIWNRCCTPAKVRWLFFAISVFPRNKRRV